NLPPGADSPNQGAFVSSDDMNKKAGQVLFADSYDPPPGRKILPNNSVEPVQKVEAAVAPVPVNPWTDETDKTLRQIEASVTKAQALMGKNQSYSSEEELMRTVALIDKVPLEQMKAYLEALGKGSSANPYAQRVAQLVE